MTDDNQREGESKAAPSNKSIAELYPDLNNRLDEYMRHICYVKPRTGSTNFDPAIVEYFGVLSLTDVRAPKRKLWYIYYCRTDEIDSTVDQIHRKYGQKNMYELFRKPVYSGVALRTRVKTNFANLKWYVKGNILEAPPQSAYTDERLIKVITDLYNAERRKYYNYLEALNNNFTYCRRNFST